MPEMSRDEFLTNVRQALGRKEALSTPPVPPGISTTPEQVQERVREVRERLQSHREERLEALAKAAEQVRWNVCRAGTLEDAHEYLDALARRLSLKQAVRSGHPVLQRLDVDGVLGRSGVQVTPMAQSEGTDARTGRAAAVNAGLGITGVDYAIADLGSCVLLPRAGVSRITSLLPPVYLAVVEAANVLDTLDDLMTLRALDAQEGKMGSYMSIISGPSRTADIEQLLLIGVHGPGEVHMVLLGEQG